jgi:hypothetical protein
MTTLSSPGFTPKTIYVTDYLNVFSDYREIKYKQDNVDFHTVKHVNKEKDTIEFFELFFTKYIAYAKIDIDSKFIFVLKKITNYEKVLIKILHKYISIDIRFVIIESKYEEVILDKNKDDFLCQYIFCFLMQKNDNCILISNDKYRDLKVYMNRFDNAFIRMLKVSNDKTVNSVMEINMKDNLVSQNKQQYKRCTIAKNNLKFIL